jgi:hypothetical protein
MSGQVPDLKGESNLQPDLRMALLAHIFMTKTSPPSPIEEAARFKLTASGMVLKITDAFPGG